MYDSHILIWLPSPMGDTVMCSPVLKALRQHYADAKITFCCNSTAQGVLTPCKWTDNWIIQGNFFKTVQEFRANKFTHALLFKNSFGSALACFLGHIPQRIGYARDARTFLLTKKLNAPVESNGKFKPIPAVDYYNAIAKKIGCINTDTLPTLEVDQQHKTEIKELFPDLSKSGPVIIMVPGAAFGLNKCWPPEYFAQTAEKLIQQYKAQIILSVSPNSQEKAIAREIVKQCKYQLINLGETPLNLGQLKALFLRADLVITNDTGPRHIAIALKRKLITLFGPNDPAWTQTGYTQEIQITAQGPCVPCQRPTCKRPDIACMHTISVNTVYKAAARLLC